MGGSDAGDKEYTIVSTGAAMGGGTHYHRMGAVDTIMRSSGGRASCVAVSVGVVGVVDSIARAAAPWSASSLAALAPVLLPRV